jgi:hypothetical protein
MQERGVMIDIASAINAELQKHSLLSASPEVLQWICHGHLGEEMIRACAANLASEHGALALTVEQVERGRRVEKQLSDAEFVAQLEENAVHPLKTLVSWAE